MNFAESLALKAVSFLLALILWITIIGFKQEERSMVIPFEPQLPPSKVVVSRIPKEIRFRFLGPRLGLKRLKTQLPEALRPDWKQYSSDTRHEITISDELLGKIPEGVKVLGAYPAKIELRLEDQITKTLLLRPHFEGQLAAGSKITAAKVTPARVKVSGPKSLLNQLTSLDTETIQIDGLQNSKSFNTSVDLGATLGLLVMAGDPQVRVDVQVSRPGP